MLERKILLPANELNRVLLKELIGINNLKIKKGHLIFDNNKYSFNSISVKLHQNAQNRVESLSLKKDEQVIVKLSKALINENEIELRVSDDLVDDELYMKKIIFNGIELSLIYSL